MANFVKGQIGNISVFAGPMVSVTTRKQPRTVINNMCLQNQAAGWV